LVNFNVMSNVKFIWEKKVRTHWDDEKEIWYFSVIDVVEILTNSPASQILECIEVQA
jgi:hypothetical protein